MILFMALTCRVYELVIIITDFQFILVFDVVGKEVVKVKIADAQR